MIIRQSGCRKIIKEIDNEKLIITYARSDEGLLFVTVTAYSVVMSQTIYLKILFYVMIALSFMPY
jgi:hypothetical protein